MMNNDPHAASRVSECRLITLDKHHHANGNLTVVQNGTSIPFDIARTFYLYDIPAGESRGGHSHHSLKQFLVAISGCFDVTVDDGVQQKTFTLKRPFEGLLVEPGIWSVLSNFSAGAVCLCLASEPFDGSDYVRNYDDFLSLTKNKRVSP